MPSSSDRASPVPPPCTLKARKVSPLLPLTTTVSSNWPTLRSAFTAAVKPEVSSTPSRRTVAKPGSVKVTVYVPVRSSMSM